MVSSVTPTSAVLTSTIRILLECTSDFYNILLSTLPTVPVDPLIVSDFVLVSAPRSDLHALARYKISLNIAKVPETLESLCCSLVELRRLKTTVFFSFFDFILIQQFAIQQIVPVNSMLFFKEMVTRLESIAYAMSWPTHQAISGAWMC